MKISYSKGCFHENHEINDKSRFSEFSKEEQDYFLEKVREKLILESKVDRTSPDFIENTYNDFFETCCSDIHYFVTITSEAEYSTCEQCGDTNYSWEGEL